MNGKTSSPSLYLSQSYQDAWDDYNRSLRSSTFPVWDYIILTASNEHQAEAFRLQIESRREYLPKKTKIGIIPDEGGVRVGSGGATLSVLKWLDSQGGWKGRRILVIHSGGDSKRVPQYSALGKLFSPVPHMLPDGRSSTLFDEFLIAMSAVPGRIREGMLLLSGDVLLLFNPLLIDWSGSGAAVVSFKEDVETGKDHGVYLKGSDGNVKSFLHKQSIETLRSVGAVNESDVKKGMRKPIIWDDYQSAVGHLKEIDRFEFYERAKNAYAVIATGEERQYANLLLVKGVVLPKEEKNSGAILRGADYYRNV